MRHFINDVYRSVTHWMMGLDQHEWFIILIFTLVLGLVLLRGTGSRAGR